MTSGFCVIAQRSSVGGSTVCVSVADPHTPSIAGSFSAEHFVFSVYCDGQCRIRSLFVNVTFGIVHHWQRFFVGLIVVGLSFADPQIPLIIF